MLSGWARSGKDAAAALLVEEFDFNRVAFADALKRDAAARTGLPLSDFTTAAKDSPLRAPCPAFPEVKTPRDILLAHALRIRAVNPNFYSELVADIIRVDPEDRWVVSDWRYRAEYETLRSLIPDVRIVRIRIERPGIFASADPSEHDLDDAPMDYILHNSGTISELRAMLRMILHTIRPEHESSPAHIHPANLEAP
jgi:hypothetical protein